jgi:hypothetical protein
MLHQDRGAVAMHVMFLGGRHVLVAKDLRGKENIVGIVIGDGRGDRMAPRPHGPTSSNPPMIAMLRWNSRSFFMDDGEEHHAMGDASWLDTWHRHTAEGFVNMGPVPRRAGIVPDTPEAHKRAHLSSMIRHFAPAAWARIAALIS